jgi:hypothetical protein
MEQRAAVRFFIIKGISSRIIHAELISVYGADAFIL